MSPDIAAALLDAGGTILAALIVGVAGSVISRRYSRERDRQDKESQWRQHAIEITRLDLERKLGDRGAAASSRLRPCVMDFLANYRDLQELGQSSPKELYEKIEKERIQRASDS